MQTSNQDSLVKRLLFSRETALIVFRYLLLAIFIIGGLNTLKFSFQSLSSAYVHRKDFIQEYLLAKAALSGVNPYAPIPELAERFIGPSLNNVVVHPTPHPPPAAFFSLPFGLLPYRQAAAMWLAFELVCLFIVSAILLHWLQIGRGISFWGGSFLLWLILLAWPPALSELVVGQIMIPLLLLLLAAWQALRINKDFLGGIALGCAVALKLLAWPLVLFLALKRRWTAVIASLTVIVLSTLLAGCLMGSDVLWSYYFQIAPLIANIYRATTVNFSLWTVFWRLFEGTYSPVYICATAPPLYYAPALAQYLFFGPALILLVVSLRLAANRQHFDVAFTIMLSASILLSPLAWVFYLTLLVLPLAVAYRYLALLDWPARYANAALALVLLLFLSSLKLIKAERQIIEISFAYSLLDLLPIVAISGLILLLWRLEGSLSGQTAGEGKSY
jgi:hypothetical protein